jgi:diadenosine tetraphosphate (Ap4A) HIT family hydrolase
MPREGWDALVRGDDCSICADIGKAENRFGFRVAELEVSNLMLARSQYARGYCLLTYREHATDLHLLPQGKFEAFNRDLVRAGTATARVFKADKMNYQLLGNLAPHLHRHVLPRYYGDAASGRPMNPDIGKRVQKRADYDYLIAELQAELGYTQLLA